MTPGQALLTSLIVCLAGAGLTALTACQRRLTGWLAFGITAVASSLALYAAGSSLRLGGVEPETFLKLPALGFALTLHVDGLSAIFIGLIASIALPATFFGIRYMDLYPEYSLRRYHPWLLVFLAAMYGLVSTTDMMWFFFIFWQMMTLPGYALIRFEHHKPENRRAAVKFLVMMQIACVATMIGAELLATNAVPAAGGATLRYDFDSISRGLPGLLEQRPGLVATAFALFLVGFGIKLGMWPFGQVWLPDAHPAAPSPMSALLSGVMLKTGVYGILRYFLWLVPESARDIYPAGAWGAWIAGLGTLTLFTGTLQALRQEQTKRLLAFHSIGQLGYILLGIGTSLLILGHGDPALLPVAAVAFAGALMHTVFHGTFKSLLFLNSGSMLWAARTQNLNQLGGLLRWMPLTGLTALVAAMSISGVPGFNGFLSKWTLYVGAIQGTPAGRLLPVCAVIGILISAVTLASFMKFFGVSFLGQTSRTVTSAAQEGKRLEVDGLMQAPQLVLAAACVLFGLVPGLAFGLVARALLASQAGYAGVLADALGGAGKVPGMPAALGGSAVFLPLAMLAVLLLLAGLAALLTRSGGASRRRATPWLTGYQTAAEPTRYTAHGLYAEFKRRFRWLGGTPGSPVAKDSEPPKTT